MTQHLTDSARNAADKLNHTGKSAVDQTRAVAEDAKDVAARLAEAAKQRLASATETGMVNLDDAAEAAGDAYEMAKDKLGMVAEKIGENARYLKDTAAETADGARKAVAGEGEKIASSLRSAAENQDDGTFQQRILESVAGGVSAFSDTLRNRSLSDVVSDAEAFARRNPAIFIAGAALAGFALARLIRPASSPRGYDVAGRTGRGGRGS